jgi:hypothetical protein
MQAGLPAGPGIACTAQLAAHSPPSSVTITILIAVPVPCPPALAPVCSRSWRSRGACGQYLAAKCGAWGIGLVGKM